jgi:hypothetical protein
MAEYSGNCSTRGGGVPFWDGAGHLNRELALPKSSGVVRFFIGKPEFSTKYNAPVYRGDSARSPNRPFALRLCRITFSGVIVPGVATAVGVEALRLQSPPKSIKKNILRILTNPKMDTLMKGFPYLKKTGKDRISLEYFFVHEIPGTRKEENEYNNCCDIGKSGHHNLG